MFKINGGMEKMKRFLLGLVAVVMAVTLSGCFGDPVKSDLEDYRKTNNLIVSQMEKSLEAEMKKMNAVSEPKDAVAPLEAMKAIILDAQKKQETFQPKSDEVKALNVKIQSGFKELDGAMDKFIAAAKSNDVDGFNAAADGLSTAADNLDKAEREFFKLAKQKGLKWVEQ